MNYDEFIKTYNGQAIDYDGVSGVQCVDLAKLYMNKVFGMNPGAWGNAKDYYLNYNSISALVQNFTRIANTSSFVPQKGDIVIWNATSSNQYGHIAVATGEGDTKQFYSYDQNYGGKAMHKVLHNYTAFLGVLRPKDQSKISGSEEKKYIPVVKIENIKKVQEWLNDTYGLNIPVNGQADKKTKEALVIAWKTQVNKNFNGNLEADIYGRIKSSIFGNGSKELSKNVTRKKGDSGKMVKIIQALCWFYGYNKNTFSGNYGDGTVDDVHNFKIAHGLSVDGTVVGQGFWTKTME